ncbi:DNA polymerase III subunit delta' [Planctomycetes bacterium MalM25]|nr:DNA polymerase III subunit delta' [Planctomycetes bacterium MalM25]
MSYVSRLKANQLRSRCRGDRRVHQVGKSAVVNQLDETNRNGMLHLVSFHGQQGVGKRFMARHAAAIALCDGPGQKSGQLCRDNPCSACRRIGRTDRTDIFEEKATTILKGAKPSGPGANVTRIAALDADVFIITRIDELDDAQQKVLCSELRDHLDQPNRVIFLTCDDENKLADDLARLLLPHLVRVDLPSEEEAVGFLTCRLQEEGMTFESAEVVVEAVEAIGFDPYGLDTLPFQLKNRGHTSLTQAAITDLYGQSDSTALVVQDMEPLEESW